MGDIQPESRASSRELMFSPCNIESNGRVVRECSMPKHLHQFPFLTLYSKIIVIGNHDPIKAFEDPFIPGSKIGPSEPSAKSLDGPWSIGVIQPQFSL